MTLPPGRDPIPVDGIDAATDPGLAKAAGELNAWLEYLFHPESHDGPRIYRRQALDSSGRGLETLDAEAPRRLASLDEDRQYATVSIIDGHQTDPGAFFRPAQAVSGISEAMIESTYTKLVQGFFTRPDPTGRPGEVRLTTLKYPELHPARMNWMQMRNGWVCRAALGAHEYENDFIAFQVHTENCFYVVAEHMTRYLAIFKQASTDIAKLMTAMTETFAKHDYHGGEGFTFDLWSILITTVVATATSVMSGVAAPITLGIAATELLGEALKTAESTNRGAQLLIEDRPFLRDTIKSYIDQVNRIESDVREAVKRLYESLRVEVDKLRDARKYEAIPNTGTTMPWAPHYRDYL